ncbi:unnamed protein product [Periconia digitata]|uniref:Uncharacterized protein n=1 Tax=Periconia digitata TaxID=1303443 RepID=A0A9W4XHD2_9PLEO|nr:unnamed protein product [Periconia digitata]
MSPQQPQFRISSKSLKSTDKSFLPALAEVLWSWNLCSKCLCGKPCVAAICPSRRTARLSRYLQFCRTAISSYTDSSMAGTRILETYGDLWYTIRTLKLNPEITRTEFRQSLLSKRPRHPADINGSDLVQATTLAVKILTMIDCSELHVSSDMLERGGCRVHWRDDVPFAKYLQDLFPIGNHPVLSYADNDLLVDMKSDLKAVKLQKHLGVTFRPTNDIRDHLRFYRKQNIVEIYHHTAFVKEQLRLTKEPGEWSNSATCIKVGALPRQLILEALVSDCSFDHDILHFEFSSIRRAGEENVTYIFLADRLSELYNELHNPRPRGWLNRQIDRKSSARHMMMATLLGVLFAIFLGMMSLVVTCYQTWIAYQAWKHPVQVLLPVG